MAGHLLRSWRWRGTGPRCSPEPHPWWWCYWRCSREVGRFSKETHGSIWKGWRQWRMAGPLPGQRMLMAKWRKWELGWLEVTFGLVDDWAFVKPGAWTFWQPLPAGWFGQCHCLQHPQPQTWVLLSCWRRHPWLLPEWGSERDSWLSPQRLVVGAMLGSAVFLIKCKFLEIWYNFLYVIYTGFLSFLIKFIEVTYFG